MKWDIGMVKRDLRHIRLLKAVRRDDLAILIELDPVGSNLEVSLVGISMGNSLLSLVQGLDLSTFPSNHLKVLEVAFTDGCDVFATEDSDFEISWLLEAVFLRNLSASALQVIQGLIDDALRTNMLGDAVSVPVISNKLLRRCQVDSVNMSMAVEVRTVQIGGEADLRYGWGATCKVDLLGSSFPCHGDDFSAGGSTNDTVIHKEHVSILELG